MIFSEQWKPFVKTPIWNHIWDKFKFSEDVDVAEWYNALTTEQKEKFQDENGRGWFHVLYNIEPEYKQKGIDYALQMVKDEDEGDFSNVNYILRQALQQKDVKTIKDIYEKLGIVDFFMTIYNNLSSTITGILDLLGVKFTPEEIEKIWSEFEKESLEPEVFFMRLGNYKLVFDKNPSAFMDYVIEAKVDAQIRKKLVDMFSAIGAENVMWLLGVLKNNKQLNTEVRDAVKPYFQNVEAELSVEDIEFLLDWYGNVSPIDIEFCRELIEQIPEDAIEHFENSKIEILSIKAKLKKNPVKILNGWIAAKELPRCLQGGINKKMLPFLFKDIDLKALREFILKAIELTKEDFEEISTYVVLHLYPDDWLNSSYVWAFERASKEKKEYFIDLVGIENFSESQLKQLFNGKIPRFEKPEKAPKLSNQVIEDKVELLRLILPLAKPK